VNMPLMKWDQLYKRWVKLDAVKVRITHVCAHVDSRHSLIPTNPIAQEDGTDEVEKEISKVHEAAAAAKARIREKRKMTARPNPEIDSIAIKDEGTSNPGACELGNSASRTIVDILRPSVSGMPLVFIGLPCTVPTRERASPWDPFRHRAVQTPATAGEPVRNRCHESTRTSRSS
jgi:hypothetical protein